MKLKRMLNVNKIIVKNNNGIYKDENDIFHIEKKNDSGNESNRNNSSNYIY